MPLVTFTASTRIVSADVNANFALCVLTDTVKTMTVPLRASDGSVSAPFLAPASDTNSGLYVIGADNLGLSLGGTKRWDFGTAGSTLTGTLTVSGAVTLQSTLALTAAATLSSTLSVAGDVVLSANTAVVRHGSSDRSLSVYGGQALNDGGSIGLYGSTHATTPSIIAFQIDGVEAGRITAARALSYQGAATFASTLAVTGVSTFSADVVVGTLRRATSDGSDSSGLVIAGGGAATDVTRGAFVDVYGNENGSFPGQARMVAGNVAGGHLLFYTGAAAERLRISDAGVATFSGAVAMSSGLTSTGVSTFAGLASVTGGTIAVGAGLAFAFVDGAEGGAIQTFSNRKLTINALGNAVEIGAAAGSLGFYGTAAIAKQTGVAVSAAGIHAALVALGLFAA
jgi:hypothetical protein